MKKPATIIAILGGVFFGFLSSANAQTEEAEGSGFTCIYYGFEDLLIESQPPTTKGTFAHQLLSPRAKTDFHRSAKLHASFLSQIQDNAQE